MTDPPKYSTEGPIRRRGHKVDKFFNRMIGRTRQYELEQQDAKRRELVEKMAKPQKDTTK